MPTKSKKHLVGYLDIDSRNGGPLTDFNGVNLGWHFDSIVSNWRLRNGERRYAVKLRRGSGQRVSFAGGLSLGSGMLFRGEVFGVVNPLDGQAVRDLANDIVAEAEYWMQADENDSEGDEE